MRPLAGVFLIAIGVGVVFLVGHDPDQPGVFPPCPVRAATGLLCPGCGTLHALYALVHGDIGAAWHANPLALLALPLMLWAVYGLGRFALGGPWPRLGVLSARTAPWLLAALTTWMVARNLR